MRQVFQDLKTGETRLAEVPRPGAGPGQVLIRSHASPVSAGTERMLDGDELTLVDFTPCSQLSKPK